MLPLTTGSPSDKPDPAQPVTRSTSAGRNIVLSCAVGEHKLLYSSTFKCLDNAGDLENLDKVTFTGLRTIKGESSFSIYRYN